MIDHLKFIFKNKRMLVYIGSAIIAVIVAILMVVLLVRLVTNPPQVLSNSSSALQTSSSNYKEMLSDTYSNKTPVIKNKNAPKISGVENDAVYYTTQYVTIYDKDLESVTVNDNAENSSFYIDGNIECTYVIKAIDAKQNATIYTVYTKPISSLLEPISHLNDNTVTSEYYSTIKNIQKQAFEIDTSYSSTDEAIMLNNVIDTCDKYLNKINSVAEKINEIANKIKEYEETQIYKDISNVFNSIDALLATDNLTEEQRLNLNNMRSKCYSWMFDLPEYETSTENME